MLSGCFTALITPFSGNGIDEEGLFRLIDFQVKNGVNGILAAGTTGESPTLSWNEHNRVTDIVAENSKNKCVCIAGAGSNNTEESLSAAEHAAKIGADAVLLVDPYYNGPSSVEIRKEYIEPIAKAYPELQMIPYVIPGRTGAQLLPEDIAILNEQYENVSTVKEATADLDNMRRTRKCCGPDFGILSGDDGLTFDMMTDPAINACGVISVVSNIVPRAAVEMVSLLLEGKTDEAGILKDKLEPLFGLVTVKTTEKTPYGDVLCRARNPLGIKTLMTILGLPSGGCRRPLGRMTQNGLDQVLQIAGRVQKTSPELFRPLSEYFNIDVEERLQKAAQMPELIYKAYV